MEDLAKKTKKQMRIGKPGGPPLYTSMSGVDVSKLQLNKREVEALNLNFASLWVPLLVFVWGGRV